MGNARNLWQAIASFILLTGCISAHSFEHPSIGPLVQAATPEARTGVVVPNEAVREIQILLKSLGYSPGPADGVMGRKTASAIAAFQNAAYVPVTGEPSAELLRTIRAHAEEHERDRTIGALMSQFKADFGRPPTEVEVGIMYELHQRPNKALEAQFRAEAARGQIWGDQAAKYFPQQ
jgi:peptidoglycan hydrolase-like protein with peptidoglycan-binding domain